MMPARAIAPFGLRMPPDLKAWIEKQAKINKRSQNAEIVFRLEEIRRTQETRSPG